jgi:High potential iron-sulfur protein
MKHAYLFESRRDALHRIAAAALACLTAAPLRALLAAEPLPHLTDANPAAASLDYTEDASTVDAGKFPKYQAGQHCANCKFFEAGAGAQYAPCRLYPGNAVNANGWCAGYAPK